MKTIKRIIRELLETERIDNGDMKTVLRAIQASPKYRACGE